MEVKRHKVKKALQVIQKRKDDAMMILNDSEDFEDPDCQVVIISDCVAIIKKCTSIIDFLGGQGIVANKNPGNNAPPAPQHVPRTRQEPYTYDQPRFDSFSRPRPQVRAETNKRISQLEDRINTLIREKNSVADALNSKNARIDALTDNLFEKEKQLDNTNLKVQELLSKLSSRDLAVGSPKLAPNQSNSRGYHHGRSVESPRNPRSPITSGRSKKMSVVGRPDRGVQAISEDPRESRGSFSQNRPLDRLEKDYEDIEDDSLLAYDTRLRARLIKCDKMPHLPRIVVLALSDLPPFFYPQKYEEGTVPPLLGPCYWEDGYYKGNFKNGKPSGRGTYVGNKGDFYQGEWKSGVRWGFGRYVAERGEVQEAWWERGRIVGNAKANVGLKPWEKQEGS